ncbi:MAG TPA: discoidin domain-containing protein [Phycisphaerae bacterium]|nr:discoidin domain-containing protein [Phycisphaerae bacterium]
MTVRSLLLGGMLALCSVAAACAATGPLRQTVSLDGEWDVAEGAMDAVPATFAHKCPVPGLADMAQPPFEGVGPKDADDRRAAFWYRRTFTLTGPVPAVATLKVHKAMFTTRVYLNGQLVGDHAPSFTPGLFDVRPHLKGDGRPNELIIRVGSSRKAVPPGRPDGWDFEKVRYIPGIYDSVELLLSGSPHVVRVQTVPDVEGKAVRVVAWVKNAGPATRAPVRFTVREVKSGREVGAAEAPPADLAPGAERTVDLRIPIQDCRLWSPEDPFLYELETSTGADVLRTRFGVRSFRFDPQTRLAVLNGKPYMLRGTNVCIYRFFEDSARGDLPWREEWVRNLIRTFRGMHWNSCRYCIGFPPELWYRIADEEGLIVQDEFPVWTLGENHGYKVEPLIEEYTEWMQERWNHPSVVIWDAQNESAIGVTGKALTAVRGLDLSDRPWDNGWGPPQRPTDVYEAHPYLFQNKGFRLPQLAGRPRNVGGNVQPSRGVNPTIINEYGWLWVNRDGTPTKLSVESRVYERLLPPNPTAEQYLTAYARTLAAETEYWRSLRQTAGVMHFCGLGYSRPGGETSDHFVDLADLKLEPHFAEYVRDAFAPVGLMIDAWAESLPAGSTQRFRVAVINDLSGPWQGKVTLRMLQGERVVAEKAQSCTVASFGREVLTFEMVLPETLGPYTLVADLPSLIAGERNVRSLRDFRVVAECIARGKPATASSSVTVGANSYPAGNAVDGNPATYWSSDFADPAWLRVDLGESVRIRRVTIRWETAYAKAFAVQVSADGRTWTDVFKTDSGSGGTSEIDFAPVAARYVRIFGTARGTEWGYAIRELNVFKK